MMGSTERRKRERRKEEIREGKERWRKRIEILGTPVALARL